jgi:hypothetical protein
VSDIFREIEDELRRDNLLKLWSRYGKYAIAVVAVVLVIAGGIVGWRQHLDDQRRAAGAQYSAALSLLRSGKGAAAAGELTRLAAQDNGYSVPAALEAAELLAKEGDQRAAVAAYDKLAADSSIDPRFRDLAVLLSVMHGLPDADPQKAIARLAPLTVSGNPWRPSALDLTAAAKLKQGDRQGALAIYRQLADDLAAPQGLRARAAELVAALKS